MEHRAISVKSDLDTLKNVIYAWGAELVGFGNVSDALPRQLEHLPYAVSIAIKHPPLPYGLVTDSQVTIAYDYRSSAIDRKLLTIEERIKVYLRRKGYLAFPIPPDTHKKSKKFISRLYPLFPHKTAATCAGLGWIGKNGLLVTKNCGPRLSWATVLTNAPLEVCESPIEYSRCGDCRKCVEKCPSGAIGDRKWARADSNGPLIDVDLCRQYLQQNEELLGYSICGICMIVCGR
ncbi:4Fe-4S binding protein [Metallumcola ferriviriculae]|uniref:4Fe-4S binding protein n=1 Tax=Metallumcola ferriviriculae TaxID=3039180 RepID=A0AAU0UPY9_9FIRM|nr:4Fe-4S binding protein [Desulfitibacteraceae bacterium MK1]